MIIRNIRQEEVMRRVYSAHGGAMATMLFDSSVLQGILFLAYGILKPGMVAESHVDPYEEIYYILEGEGVMCVDADEKSVRAGDAIWVPCGSVHSLTNYGEEDCVSLVMAAMPRNVT